MNKALSDIAARKRSGTGTGTGELPAGKVIMSELQKKALLEEPTLYAGTICPIGYPLGCALGLKYADRYDDIRPEEHEFYYPTEGQYGECRIYSADSTSTPIAILRANPKEDAPYYIEFWTPPEFTENLAPGKYILEATLCNADGSDASEGLYDCPAFACVDVGNYGPNDGWIARPDGCNWCTILLDKYTISDIEDMNNENSI